MSWFMDATAILNPDEFSEALDALANHSMPMTPLVYDLIAKRRDAGASIRDAVKETASEVRMLIERLESQKNAVKP